MEFSHDQYNSELTQAMGNSTNITSGIGETYFLLIIVAVSIIFFSLSLLMSLYMIRRRKKEILRLASDKNLIEKYQRFLSDMIILPNIKDGLILSTTHSSMTERLQLSDITDKYKRRILIQEIYSFKLYLSGNQAAQLASYFFGLSLQEDVQMMLEGKSWTEKLMALKYIQVFDIEECLPQISLLLKHSNKDLAFQAFLTQLSIEKNFDKISEYYFKLNNWEKHKLIDMASKQGVSIDDY